MGVSLSFSIICKCCRFEDQVFFSPDIKQNKPGINPKKINIRSVMVFCKISRGREAMVMFVTIISMPPLMNKDNFDAINGNFMMHI